MDTRLLEKTASDLVAAGKGILAADESNGTMSSRLEAVGVSATSETRRSYRTNLFSTKGYEDSISGVILLMKLLGRKWTMVVRYPRHYLP